jgi:hypothetical protein
MAFVKVQAVPFPRDEPCFAHLNFLAAAIAGVLVFIITANIIIEG